ncbi:MAG: hypothetical protein GY832_15300 [Chloroflexi bacterium]|nr:hypothetical protein [Chloroflexota bacterium]
MTTYAKVQVEFVSTEQGGRERPPSLDEYAPHFRVSPDSEMLGIRFIDGPDTEQTEGKAHATVEFLYEPKVCYDVLGVGTFFEILEGPTVVGYGTITSRYESKDI